MSETAQRAPETDEKKSRGLGSYVLWAFVAVMVYVLSSGPVFRFTSQTGKIAIACRTWTTKFYAPLKWVARKTPLRKPFVAYWNLWAPPGHSFVFTPDH
jgi:hypothetical protein